MLRPASEVLVTVPTRGSVQAATIMRLQQIRDESSGLPPIQYVPGHLSTAETRNRIINQFLEGPWSCLVMVDDDTVPSRDFLDLCDHVNVEEYAVVGQPYLLAVRPEEYWAKTRFVPGRKDQPDVGLVYCVYDLAIEEGLPIADGVGIEIAETYLTGVHDCYAICSGAIAISRAALEVFCGAADDPMRPWQFSSYNGQMIGSDITFCHRMHQLGYRVGADWSGVADHQPVVSLETIRKAVRR